MLSRCCCGPCYSLVGVVVVERHVSSLASNALVAVRELKQQASELLPSRAAGSLQLGSRLRHVLVRKRDFHTSQRLVLGLFTSKSKPETLLPQNYQCTHLAMKVLNEVLSVACRLSHGSQARYPQICYVDSKRFGQRRAPTRKEPRSFEDRNYEILHRFDDRRLKLGNRVPDKPEQWTLYQKEVEKRVVDDSKRKIPFKDHLPQYHQYSKEDIERIQHHGELYDPLFNPRLHEERNRVNPDEETFNAI